jgi:hypothetical protein
MARLSCVRRFARRVREIRLFGTAPIFIPQQSYGSHQPSLKKRIKKAATRAATAIIV